MGRAFEGSEATRGRSRTDLRYIIRTRLLRQPRRSSGPGKRGIARVYNQHHYEDQIRRALRYDFHNSNDGALCG